MMHLDEVKARGRSELAALEKAVAMQRLQAQWQDDISLSTEEHLGEDQKSLKDQAYGEARGDELRIH